MSDRILTTHAGSLPRPDDLVDMIWAPAGRARRSTRRRSSSGSTPPWPTSWASSATAGIDVVSDGEMSKTGFSTYVNERFSGFDGRSEFQADDVADFPEPGDAPVQHPVDGPPRVLQLRRAGRADRQGRRAPGRRPAQARASATPIPRARSWARSAPARSRSTTPTSTTARTRPTSPRWPTRSPTSTRRSPTPGFMLQIDSPDMAMAAHCRSVGSQRRRLAHPPAARGRGAQRRAGRDPARAGPAARLLGQLRRARTTRTSPLAEIIDRRAARSTPARSTSRARNPRHEHEWRVFEDAELPDDTSVILGVIDVKSNHVEHPLVVADRLVQLGKIVGKDRLHRRAPTAALTRSSASRWSIPTSPG